MEIGIENMINEISSEISDGFSISELKTEFEKINRSYRNKNSRTDDYRITDEKGAIAYLLYRMPATANVISKILNELKSDFPDFNPEDILDIGSGPGVSLLPISIIFEDTGSITLVEEMKTMADLGKKITDKIPGINGKVRWINFSFNKISEERKYDLVLASYMLNELDETETEEFIRKIDRITGDIAVVIVPGTPEFFRQLLYFRKSALDLGFNILSPCTFTGKCHMEQADNWCHFSERIQRTSILRKIKDGELPYEDEKYSYIVLSKNRHPSEGKRIIRHPLIRKGLTEVMTCDINGIEETKVTKSKNAGLYKLLKKAGWGDRI